MQTIAQIMVSLVFLKSVLGFSGFNFYYYYRYGSEYTNWYFNQPEFNPVDKQP